MSFEAKYGGWCSACADDIDPGNRVTYSDEQLVHVECLNRVDPDEPQRNERQCPDCFTIHAGECL